MEPEPELLSFPCNFPVKAMGKATDDFDSLVMEIIRKHAPDINPDAVKVRSSHGGNFISVTVVVRAKSKAQLDKIYMDLTAHERILMAL